jgi:hypothetical protein
MTVDAATQEGGDLNPSDHPELSPSELIDLRAAQRTYQGAWLRTSLANLGYAAVVLKVFDRRFFGSASHRLPTAFPVPTCHMRRSPADYALSLAPARRAQSACFTRSSRSPCSGLRFGGRPKRSGRSCRLPRRYSLLGLRCLNSGGRRSPEHNPRNQTTSWRRDRRPHRRLDHLERQQSTQVHAIAASSTAQRPSVAYKASAPRGRRSSRPGRSSLSSVSWSARSSLPCSDSSFAWAEGSL